MNKKSQDYIKLRDFLAENAVEAEIETILSVYKSQYSPEKDPIAFWGIECDSSPELRNIKVKAEILKGIALIADLNKTGKLHELETQGKKRSHRKSGLSITGKLIEAANSINADADNLIVLYKNNWRQGATLEVMRGHLAGVESHMRYADRGVQDKIISLLGQIFRAEKGRDWKENIHENREKKIEIPDLFFVDDNGREKINWYILREFVQESFVFKTVKDTDELMVYENGIYIDARKTVRDFVHRIKGVDDSASIKIIRELIQHIKARTGIEREELNKDVNYLPLKNGLYNFETKKLEDFDPEKYYTFRLPVKYDPAATYEGTKRFMAEVADEGDFDVLQEIFGYSLYPGFPSHHFFWLYGTGRNGKGVYTALLSAMIGRKNKASVPITQLDGHHRFASARLMGKLLNVIPESNAKQGLETEVLKAMTGQDMIGGEKKGVQESFDFINFAKFLIHSNAFPTIDDTSDAFWDRVIPIPFPKKFTGVTDKKDHWKDIVKEDCLSGILNYALEGFYRLRNNDWEFTASATQGNLKANMRRMAQPTQTFQEQWTVLNNRATTSIETLYSAMQEYCDEYCIIPPSERDFVRDITSSHNVIKKREQSGEYRKLVLMGIKLKNEIHVRMTLKALGEGNEKEKVKDEPIEPLSEDRREVLER
jgi:P4 family phage/plasmid primase-like protien